MFLLRVRLLNDLLESWNCDLATVCLCKKTGSCFFYALSVKMTLKILKDDPNSFQVKENSGIKLSSRKFSPWSKQPNFEHEGKQVWDFAHFSASLSKLDLG